MDGARAIVVATTLDDRSTIALSRAFALAQLFSAKLRVVHSLPVGVTALVEPSHDAVLRWAMREAKIALAREDVLISVGNPTRALDRAAAEIAADLIVTARSAEGRSETVRSLVGILSRSVFVADEPRDRTEIVAATDLEDLDFPVVLWAARLGRALQAHVTIVHKVEPDGPSLSFHLDGALQRLDALHRLSRELKGVSSRQRKQQRRSACEAIASVARARDADIAIVGVRPGGGRTLAGLLSQNHRGSVLAVPLPRVAP